MANFDPSRISWLKPWEAISHEYASKAEAELFREMSPKHILFGRSVRAVGHRIDCDDILFHLGETPPQFAVVHLTFQRELRPEWPHTTLFDSLNAWLDQCMVPDAAEYAR